MTDFDTFDISKPRRANGRYAPLLDLPLGAHVHYSISEYSPKSIRAGVSTINRTSAPVHFSVLTVGGEDPKGAGVRVLRDDKPLRVRPTVSV